MDNSYKLILKFKLIVKVLSLILVFAFSNSWGQATIPVSRTAWGTTPTGWTDNQGSGPTYATDICSGSGSSSGRLDAAGENFILFYNAAASTLTFCVKGNTGAGAFSGTFLIQESADGTTYTAGQSVAVTTSAVSQTVNIGCNSRYVKFLFSVQTNGNIQLDNVSLTTGTCSACTPPTTTITPTSQTVCTNVTTAITVTSSATIPTYQWQMSASGAGPFINVANGTPTGVTYTSGTTAATLSAVGTSSAQYFYQCLVTDGGTCTATSNTVSLTIKAAPAITTQPVSVSTTSTGTASYTVVSSGTGLSYQWQQSSGGAFGNISNGGSNPTYAGATASVLTISNPPLSMSGYSYQCIVANSCGTVTTNGTSTINVTNSLTCPSITGALINACDDAGCAEGNNEVLFLNSGSYAIPVNGTNINIEFNGTNFTGSFTPNAALTASLNTAAGCSLFTDASSGTIPSNSTFIMLNDDVCLNYNFSSYCSVAPIYVIYSSGAWNSSGFFTNTGLVVRSWVTDFSSVSATCPNATYSYIPDNLTAFGGTENGASVAFDNLANPTYVNNGCTPPTIILPIELVDFYATKNNKQNDVVWKVASEENIVYYTIDKSNDGVNFNELATVFSNNTTQRKTYSVIDDSPFNDVTYYRLGTKEKDGKMYYHKIISIDEKSSDWNCIHFQQEQNLVIEFKNTVPKNSTIHLFDLSGKQLAELVVKESQTTINTQAFAEGIYFLKISTPYKTENFKIIITK